MSEIIVTTMDIKEEYEVIGPLYYKISNKGLFNTELKNKLKEYKEKINVLKKGNLISEKRNDWGFLYGEMSFGIENEFDTAFFIAVEEIKKRAGVLGADAVVGMRQDIDLDTNNIQWFYLQMYGTAVRIKNKKKSSNEYDILSEMDTDKIRDIYISTEDIMLKNACKNELIKRGF